MDTDRPSVDLFDRIFGSLDGLPGVLFTGQSTVQSTTPLLGNVELHIVQTVRHPDLGDTVFLQVIAAGQSLRLVIPPKVAATIARQRDQLTKRTRRKGARQAVATKRERGIAVGNPEALRKARKAARGKK
jgi:hypothetical protein